LPNAKGFSKGFDSRGLARIHGIMFPHNAPETSGFMWNRDPFGNDGMLKLPFTNA